MHHNMTIQQIQYDPSYEAERKKMILRLHTDNFMAKKQDQHMFSSVSEKALCLSNK